MSREREDELSDCCVAVGCGCGCSIIPISVALALFGVAVGGGCSVKIPLTEANVTAAGSIGNKDLTRKVLPGYARERVASSEDFIDGSSTLTAGPVEGVGLFVIGKQKDAPVIDFNITTATK